MGSSPRVRGARPRADGLRDLHGIIPACAGNTNTALTTIGGSWDHPRVCGEHSLASRSVRNIVGSSPRVRGTSPRARDRRQWPGIIPARAGNIAGFQPREFGGRDHPRVCGEHVIRIPPLVSLPGSSPRVRGTLSKCSLLTQRRRHLRRQRRD